MSSVLKIGVTGGIGSGKSTVCKVIEKMGYPVFYSDIEAQKAMSNDVGLKEALIQLLGEQVYVNNELNRNYISNLIFSNPQLLTEINKCVHPVVRELFSNFVVKNKDSKLVFNEAAILFETGAYKNFDATILVVADEKQRIERVMKRDSISKEQVEERMKSQWNDEEKIGLADFVISNNDSSLVLPQIEVVVSALLTKLVKKG
jgi:dephospho-CoA kinase